MTQPILEGTPSELAPYLAQHPTRRFRLIDLSEGVEEIELDQFAPVLDENAKSALALRNDWIAEGVATAEEALIATDQEDEEFNPNLNANRAATGERPVYPS